MKKTEAQNGLMIDQATLEQIIRQCMEQPQGFSFTAEYTCERCFGTFRSPADELLNVSIEGGMPGFVISVKGHPWPFHYRVMRMTFLQQLMMWYTGATNRERDEPADGEIPPAVIFSAAPVQPLMA